MTKRLRGFGVIAAMAAMLPWADPAWAAPAEEGLTISIRTNYYALAGTNAQSLWASLRASGPKGYHAFTDWKVQWTYSFRPGRTECTLRSFDTKVDVRYTVPRWAGYETADPALRQEWVRYVQSLIAHEIGHSDIAIATGREIAQFVKTNTWRAADCQQLKNRIDEECQRIVNERRAQEMAYDRKTGHGRTQGAFLQGHRRPVVQGQPQRQPPAAGSSPRPGGVASP